MGAIRSKVCIRNHPFIVRGGRQVCPVCERERVRKEEKDHGAGGRIAGVLEPGDRVVITEDTVTRGTSLLEAARVVRDYGADVVLLLAVVDRGGTAASMAKADGWRFDALFSAPDLGFEYEGA